MYKHMKWYTDIYCHLQNEYLQDFNYITILTKYIQLIILYLHKNVVLSLKKEYFKTNVRVEQKFGTERSN